MDPQKVLPQELCTRILDSLPGDEVVGTRRVCRAWRQCAEDQIEDRRERRQRRARLHRARGVYAPVRLQTPEQAPYKVRFSPCSGQMLVHFVCRPPSMFGMLAYAPSMWHDVVLQRQRELGPMVDTASSLSTHSTQVPQQILSQAIAGRLAAWYKGAPPLCALATDMHSLAWLDQGKAYLLDLTSRDSRPVQLVHPDHAHFTGYIAFSPDASFLSAGSLVLDSCIGAALFDFGAPLLY